VGSKVQSVAVSLYEVVDVAAFGGCSHEVVEVPEAQLLLHDTEMGVMVIPIQAGTLQ